MTKHGRPSPEFYKSLPPAFMFSIVHKWVKRNVNQRRQVLELKMIYLPFIALFKAHQRRIRIGALLLLQLWCCNQYCCLFAIWNWICSVEYCIQIFRTNFGTIQTTWAAYIWGCISFEIDFFKYNLKRYIFIQKFGLKLVNRVYQHVGFHQKPYHTALDISNRYNVVKYACKFGNKQCIADARVEYDRYLKGNYT